MAKSKNSINNIIGDDPRTPKLIGVLLLFFATYLFVACFSYIFTWQIDQDKVNHFEMELIYQDIEVANWLGRSLHRIHTQAAGKFKIPRLDKDLADDARGFHARQAHVKALVPIRQARMIDAERMLLKRPFIL